MGLQVVRAIAELAAKIGPSLYGQADLLPVIALEVGLITVLGIAHGLVGFGTCWQLGGWAQLSLRKGILLSSTRCIAVEPVVCLSVLDLRLMPPSLGWFS